MDLGKMILMLTVTLISVIFALNVYPIIHNAVDQCATYNATMYCTSWKNTTPLSAMETGMLGLIPLLTTAAIALIPVGLLYYVTEVRE
jgi:hypothetical protein